MESVYIETTVVGSIAGRLHPDLRVSVRQQATRDWWATARKRYRLYVSRLTLAECEAGDPVAAAERILVLEGIERLAVSEEAELLASRLLATRAVPASQPRDAMHIALATVHGVELLATWNFKHILNPHVQKLIAKVCSDSGRRVPVICTPEQLLESEDDS